MVYWYVLFMDMHRLPGPIAQSDACPTGSQEVVDSILRFVPILSFRLIMKSFLRSFTPFRWFKRAVVSYWRNKGRWVLVICWPWTLSNNNTHTHASIIVHLVRTDLLDVCRAINADRRVTLKVIHHRAVADCLSLTIPFFCLSRPLRAALCRRFYSHG